MKNETTSANEQRPTTLFVDGNCIVCDMEISHYKKLAPKLFDLVDISDPAFDAKKHGLTTEAVMKNMHAMKPDGTIVTGVEAFAHIWERIPKYQWAARLIHAPGINQAAKVGYSVFAAVRPWLPKKHR